MALSKESVKTAWNILHEINPKANNSWIKDHDPEDEFKEDYIIGYDKKADDGWENVFLNVRDITPEQLAIFERRKSEVPNSSFCRDEGNGITCLGWF
jgi:hypothetical protein